MFSNVGGAKNVLFSGRGYQSEFYKFSVASGHMAVVFLGCDPAIY